MSRQFDPNEPEWMDRPQPVTPELADDLANLRTLNRWFGGISTVLDPLRDILTPDREWRLLDLATGSGDIPLAVADWCHARGIRCRIDAVDFQASTLELARRHCSRRPEIQFHCGDIRSFGAGSHWDVVTCALALHHFSESDAVRVLERMRFLASHTAIAADLRRSPLGTIAVDTLTAVWMRAAMTRNDARASVRSAFSFPEFSQMLAHAGWTAARHERTWSFRQVAVLRK